jgi:hypothetical protein
MDALERIQAYRMMVSQIFQSVEEGYEHYNRYAKVKGFSVRLHNKEH